MSADYAEERASELEVLHSIYPDELTGEQHKQLATRAKQQC